MKDYCSKETNFIYVLKKKSGASSTLALNSDSFMIYDCVVVVVKENKKTTSID